MCLDRNIRYLRKKNKYSQDFIADKLGYKSYTTIQKWETGVAEPSIAKLRALAELFGVDVNDIVTKDLERTGEKMVSVPEQKFNSIVSKRLRYYLNKYEITQAELAKRLGVGTTSVYNWCNGIKTPRMDKVDAMCELFNCKRSDLIIEKNDEDEEPYYLNDETREIAQEVFEKPGLRSLFHAARDLTPEQLQAHVDFMQKMKAQERGNYEEGC